MSSSDFKRAWICTTDTFCQGVVASWRDDSGKPCLYDTREEAEKDANDEEMLATGNDPDGVEEVYVTDDKIIGVVDGRLYWQKGDKP